MPRMREAIRSGWKTSKSSTFSPLDANITGRPVTWRTDSAAPPRASPSSLASTTPSKPTPSRNASAVVTASWPTMASMTKRISSGWTASRMSAACCIISASIAEPPGGVDDHDVVELGAGVVDALPCHLDRIADAAARLGAEDRDAGLLADDLQLLHRVGSLQVGRDQHRLVALVLEPTTELRRRVWSYRHPAGRRA